MYELSVLIGGFGFVAHGASRYMSMGEQAATTAML